MIKVITPATSANLGPGFDSLGIALSLCNTFEVEKSRKFEVSGGPKKYQNEDNLFIVAFKKVCVKAGKLIKCSVKITTKIPVSRGLGSSASLIVAGAIAANELLGNPFSKDEIFNICAELEGHPDNVAPCLYGGLHMAYKDGDEYSDYILHLSDNVYFTVIIPDYELSTEEARSVLPDSYSRSDVVYNLQRAVLTVKSLEYGDHFTLRKGSDDKIATPYRKGLIKDFKQVQKIVRYNSGTCLLISGSGSTMLAISDQRDFATKIKPSLPENLKIMDLGVDNFGARIIYNEKKKKETKKKAA